MEMTTNWCWDFGLPAPCRMYCSSSEFYFYLLNAIVKEHLFGHLSRSCVWVVASLFSVAVLHVCRNKYFFLLNLGMNHLLWVQGTVPARKCWKQQAIVALGCALSWTLGVCILPCTFPATGSGQAAPVSGKQWNIDGCCHQKWSEDSSSSALEGGFLELWFVEEWQGGSVGLVREFSEP